MKSQNQLIITWSFSIGIIRSNKKNMTTRGRNKVYRSLQFYCWRNFEDRSRGELNGVKFSSLKQISNVNFEQDLLKKERFWLKYSDLELSKVSSKSVFCWVRQEVFRRLRFLADYSGVTADQTLSAQSKRISWTSSHLVLLSSRASSRKSIWFWYLIRYVLWVLDYLFLIGEKRPKFSSHDFPGFRIEMEGRIFFQPSGVYSDGPSWKFRRGFQLWRWRIKLITPTSELKMKAYCLLTRSS